MTNVLDREEYIEQAYFFRTMRERVEYKMPTQQILDHLPQEILSTTRLPIAVQFIGSELKHSGRVSSGFTQIPHYFTPLQELVMQNTEPEMKKFTLDAGQFIRKRAPQTRRR